MTTSQKYLLYQAYHEYKKGNVFPMDLATSLIEEGIDPSSIEDLFEEGLTPMDLTGDDETDPVNNFNDDLYSDYEYTSMADYLKDILAEEGEERSSSIGMTLRLNDLITYEFDSLTTSVIEDVETIEEFIANRNKKENK